MKNLEKKLKKNTLRVGGGDLLFRIHPSLLSVWLLLRIGVSNGKIGACLFRGLVIGLWKIFSKDVNKLVVFVQWAKKKEKTENERYLRVVP